ncbi:MAG: hypothetical protein JSS72_10470 [Armatimonadetes bacterium]|nr:hypothetical protein [Armatimonadota bacterium]
MLACRSSDPVAVRLLAQHPKVSSAVHDDFPGLGFGDRAILINDFSVAVRGLPEIMDNNPLVCANKACIPGPGETMALIALAPILRAGLTLEELIIQTNAPVSEPALGQFIGDLCALLAHEPFVEPVEYEECLVLVARMLLAEELQPQQIDDLYQESYGRSFFVQHLESPLGVPPAVHGSPAGFYRCRTEKGGGVTLVTCEVFADQNGKAGAAQLIHVMNIMCGFEENLGIPESVN